MKKAVVHYFTGTGNSLLAAKQLDQELKSYGYELTYHAIESGVVSHIEDYVLHIFSYPVYATSVPHIMRKYIRRLPNGNGVKAAVICTNGSISRKHRNGYQGWALHQARLYLKIKNYDVFYSEALDYPHNVTVGIPPLNQEKNHEIIAKTSKIYLEMAKQIAEGQKHHRSIFYPHMIWSIPFGVLYSLVGRRLIGKLFATDASCTSCKLCQNKCPAYAIKTVKHGNHWRWNCEGCLRCMNICPKHSIQTSLIRLLLLSWVTIANPLYLLYQFLPQKLITGSPGAWILHLLFDILLFIVFVDIMDGLLYLLSYIPFFKKMIGFGHTKFFGRYHAKSFEKTFLKD